MDAARGSLAWTDEKKIGDGVFAFFDGEDVILQTNQYLLKNTIFIDDETMEGLVRYYNQVHGREVYIKFNPE